MTKYDLKTYRAAQEELKQLKRLERDLVKMGVDPEEVYGPTKRRLAEKLNGIETAIASLDPVERMILRLRYIEGCSWTQISFAVHYSRTQTFDIHKEALRKLENQ